MKDRCADKPHAEYAYQGHAGTAYWKRNLPRLLKEQDARRAALRSLVPVAARNQRWLEVGCGRGFNLRSGDVGLDSDDRQLRFLPDGVTGIHGSASRIAAVSASFVVVLSVGCLMHQSGVGLTAALAEMARVSSQFVILGEYLAESEVPLAGKRWDGMLWARAYAVPDFFLQETRCPLPPFDEDLTFQVWRKQGRIRRSMEKPKQQAEVWTQLFNLVTACRSARLNAAKKASYQKFTDVSIINSRFRD